MCRRALSSACPRAGCPPAGRADVAQLVEHITRNDGVRGSSPRVGSSPHGWLARDPSLSSDLTTPPHETHGISRTCGQLVSTSQLADVRSKRSGDGLAGSWADSRTPRHAGLDRFVAICLVFAGAAAGAVGGLDSSFSGDGKAVTDFTSRHDWASAVVVQSDGAILVAGESGYGSGARFGVARYRTDGTLDPSFGGDGKVRTDLTNGIDFAYDMALQADGKIVVTGEARRSDRAIRVSASFVTTPTARSMRASVAVTASSSPTSPAERIGETASPSRPTARSWSAAAAAIPATRGRSARSATTRTGRSTRPSGSTAQKRIDITPVRDWANSVTLQTDGKIVLAGESGFGTRNPSSCWFGLDGDGVPDPTFGGDGIRTVDVTGYHTPRWRCRSRPTARSWPPAAPAGRVSDLDGSRRCG